MSNETVLAILHWLRDEQGWVPIVCVLCWIEIFNNQRKRRRCECPTCK